MNEITLPTVTNQRIALVLHESDLSRDVDVFQTRTIMYYRASDINDLLHSIINRCNEVDMMAKSWLRRLDKAEARVKELESLLNGNTNAKEDQAS